MKFNLLLLFSLLIFSCSETPQTITGIETYQLISQTVEIKDTTFKTDANGNPTSEIANINETSFPIRDNIKETWHFENQTLKISTQLKSDKTQDVIYQVENTDGGFFLKRENENQFCKIVTKTSDELILETRGKIILKKIKN
ncbi:MAG: hypothetical protein ACJAT4_002485 [Granulosicoccus sp.]|jgi:hypothetical protein